MYFSLRAGIEIVGFADRLQSLNSSCHFTTPVDSLDECEVLPGG